MVYMALIEIDGVPIKNMMIFHGYVSHNQMAIYVYIYIHMIYMHIHTCKYRYNRYAMIVRYKTTVLPPCVRKFTLTPGPPCTAGSALGLPSFTSGSSP